MIDYVIKTYEINLVVDIKLKKIASKSDAH